MAQGPSIKYITLFLANFDPLTLSHFVKHPGTPQSTSHISNPPIFSRPSTKKPGQKPPVQILSQLFAGFFVRGCFVMGSFVWKVLFGVVFVPFSLLSEYICYNRNITLSFMFHMYDKKSISVTSHAPDPLPLSQTVTPSRTPSPPSSVTYFMDSPTPFQWRTLGMANSNQKVIADEKYGQVNPRTSEPRFGQVNPRTSEPRNHGQVNPRTNERIPSALVGV